MIGKKENWNFVYGCTKCSPACLNCYAAEMGSVPLFAWAKGLAYKEKGRPANWSGEIRVDEKRIDMPFHWKEPRLIFINDFGDTFHNEVPDSIIDKACDVIEKCPQHQFRFCTKRARRMRQYLTNRYPNGTPANLWVGVSVGCAGDIHLANDLVQIKVNGLRWISMEPLIGPVDLESKILDSIRFVVLGGESGRNARPMNYDWARALIKQIKAPGRNIALHLKQIGMFDQYGKRFKTRTSHFIGSDLLDGFRYREFPDGIDWQENWERSQECSSVSDGGAL